MKSYILAAYFLSAFFVNIYAQAPGIDWAKAYGGDGNDDRCYSIKQTTDGGYIVAGVAQFGGGDVSGHHGYYDYWVVKLNVSGDTIWTKSLGNRGLQEATSIDQTSDGGYIVAGNTTSDDLEDVSGTHGGRDYWVVKLGSSGNIEWQKSLGGSSADYAYSITQTTDGGYIVAGDSESNNGDVIGDQGLRSGAWIVKLSSTGSIQWQKSPGAGSNARCVQQTFDGGYIIAGGYNLHTGTGDYWVAKLNSGGDTVWTKRYGGSGNDFANSIEQTRDFGYIVAGSTASSDGDVHGGNHGGFGDYWVVKLDGFGNIIWEKNFGSSGGDEANSVAQTADGGYIVAGYASSNDSDLVGSTGYAGFWLVKLDPSGDTIWTKSLGSLVNGNARSVIQTSDGGYVVAGGSGDFWVIKLLGSLIVFKSTTVTKNITDSSTIEIDSLNYKLITVTPTGGPPNALSGDVTTTVTVNSTISSLNGHPFVRRHYDIVPAANAANATAIITLYFTQLDFDHFNAFVTINQLNLPLLPMHPTDNTSNVRVTQFAGTFSGTSDPANYNNGSSIFIPTSVVWDNTNNWWAVTFPVTHFSGFYLTTGNLVLPVTFLEFTGSLQKNDVTLKWKTSNEANSKEFFIERSNQHTSFSGIGKVPAKSIPGIHQYSFTDANPLPGNHFYRLKTVDKNGHFTYSNILTIKINETVFKFSGYPNPVKNIINVRIPSAYNRSITLIITDLAGKSLLSKIATISNVESLVPLNIETLPKGTYVLKILFTDGKENTMMKFVKE